MYKLLIADDDDSIVDIMTSGLDPSRFDVTSVSDGNAAIEMIENLSPDIAILDVVLPGASAFDILAKFKESNSNPISIAITGKEYISYKEIYDANFHSLLRKPFGCEELVATIDRLLRLVKPFTPLKSLTKRENQILALVAQGKTSPEIADELNISQRTVESHRYNMRKSLGLKNSYELIKYAAGRVNPEG